MRLLGGRFLHQAARLESPGHERGAEMTDHKLEGRRTGVADGADITMSAEASGTYLTLLVYRWIEAYLPDPGTTLARLCGVDARTHRMKVEPVLRALLVSLEGQPGPLVNLRLN